MALLKNNVIVDDPFVDATGQETIPADGAVLVDLHQWQCQREQLTQRADPVGVRLRSDQPPDLIAGDLESLALVALEFPVFRDGRAYSYARLLRGQYRFDGEIRAVGDVLLEQLHFMERTGFDAFELESDDPIGDLKVASADFDVWYQPAADGRLSAMQLRHRAD